MVRRCSTRIRERLRVNAYGRELLPLARELLERYAELERASAVGAATLRGQLRIGAGKPWATIGWGNCWAAFCGNARMY